MIRGPGEIALGQVLPDSGDLRHRGRSPGPRPIANRTRTRGFRATLRRVRNRGDWGVGKNGQRFYSRGRCFP